MKDFKKLMENLEICSIAGTTKNVYEDKKPTPLEAVKKWQEAIKGLNAAFESEPWTEKTAQDKVSYQQQLNYLNMNLKASQKRLSKYREKQWDKGIFEAEENINEDRTLPNLLDVYNDIHAYSEKMFRKELEKMFIGRIVTGHMKHNSRDDRYELMTTGKIVTLYTEDSRYTGSTEIHLVDDKKIDYILNMANGKYTTK